MRIEYRDPKPPVIKIVADFHGIENSSWKAIVDCFDGKSACIYVGDESEADYLTLDASQFDDLAEVCKAAAAEIRRRAGE